MRRLYFTLGWVFFGLGAVGVAVPGLPTTPFMLLALWMFSKSSQRFHDWLYAHKLFGPALRQWHRYGVIPLKAKLIAIITMVLSLTYMVGFTDMPGWLKGGTGLLMLYGAWFVLSKPSRVEPSRYDAGQVK